MKLALIGGAPSSRLLAPFSNPDWEIWACSPNNHDLPRVDAWFEFHDLDRKWGLDKYRETLRRHPRVYLGAQDARMPNGILFDPMPYVAKYGAWCFSSSLAWMMARALEQKPASIGFWGVDMAGKPEYRDQKPGLHFFIREARKLGIEIFVPPQSDLLQDPPLYGFKEHWPMFKKLKARDDELQDRLSKAKAVRDSKLNEIFILEGARDDLDYHMNIWMRDEPPEKPRFISAEDVKALFNEQDKGRSGQEGSP